MPTFKRDENQYDPIPWDPPWDFDPNFRGGTPPLIPPEYVPPALPPEEPTAGDIPIDEILDETDKNEPYEVRHPIVHGVAIPVPSRAAGQAVLGAIIGVLGSQRSEEIVKATEVLLEDMYSKSIDVLEEWVTGNTDKGERVVYIGGGRVRIVLGPGTVVAEPAPEIDPEPDIIPAPARPAVFPDVEPANDPEYDPEDPIPILVPMPPAETPEDDEEDPYKVIEIPVPYTPDPYNPDIHGPEHPEYPNPPGRWPDPEPELDPEQWDEREYPPGQEPIEYPHGTDPWIVHSPLPPHPDVIPHRPVGVPYEKEMPDGSTKTAERQTWYDVEWSKPYPGNPIPELVIVGKEAEVFVEPRPEPATETAQPAPETTQSQESAPSQDPAPGSKPSAQTAPTQAPASGPVPRPGPATATASAVMHRISVNVLSRLFGPALNPFFMWNILMNVHPNGRIEIKQKTAPKAKARTAETIRDHGGKKAHQNYYMAMLRFINQTYGRIDEIEDFLDIIKQNLIVNGNRLSKHEDWTVVFRKVRNGDVDLDWQNVMIDLLEMTVEDMVIGQMSQIERKMMLDKFGDSH